MVATPTPPMATPTPIISGMTVPDNNLPLKEFINVSLALSILL